MWIPCLIIALSGLAFPTLCGQAAARTPTPAVAQAARPTERGQEIRWQKSLAAAKAMAVRTGKPLFVLHLFGRLDQEFC
jgi:hypothetical protein